MNTKKILMGGLAGGAAYFLIGLLIYGVLLADFMNSNFNPCILRPQDEMVMWAMIVSHFFLAFLVAIIMGWSKSSGLLAGIKIGGVTGFFSIATLDLIFYGMSVIFLNMTIVVCDIIAFTLMSALGGAIVGWVMGLGKKE